MGTRRRHCSLRPTSKIRSSPDCKLSRGCTGALHMGPGNSLGAPERVHLFLQKLSAMQSIAMSLKYSSHFTLPPDCKSDVQLATCDDRVTPIMYMYYDFAYFVLGLCDVILRCQINVFWFLWFSKAYCWVYMCVIFVYFCFGCMVVITFVKILLVIWIRVLLVVMFMIYFNQIYCKWL